MTRRTVAAERAERAQVFCLHNATHTRSHVEAREGGNACHSHRHRASSCLSFRGEVLDDKPRYHGALRQVHTPRHTQIYSTHKHVHAQTEIEAQRPGLPAQGLLLSGVQATL